MTITELIQMLTIQPDQTAIVCVEDMAEGEVPINGCVEGEREHKGEIYQTLVLTATGRWP